MIFFMTFSCFINYDTVIWHNFHHSSEKNHIANYIEAIIPEIFKRFMFFNSFIFYRDHGHHFFSISNVYFLREA